MKLKHVFLSLLISIFIPACTSQPDYDSIPQFSVTSSQKGDTITITSEQNISIIEVKSPSGIGSASFELVSGDLPNKILVRLYMEGLEEFRLLYKDTIIVVSTSSGSEFNISNQTVFLSSKEQQILPGQPLWMELKITPVQTSQNGQIEQGYFEITFPQEFIDKNVGSFEIQWVDFFRQS